MLILTPSDATRTPTQGTAAQLAWVRSADGQQAGEHGRCAAALLPADAEVVLVLPVRALSWHRLALPKVAPTRLRSVLDGLLEERLLGDTAHLHFALEPGTRSGQTLWVAACDKAWLSGWLQALASAGRPVSRIVPMLWPLAPNQPSLHWAHDEGDHAWLASASAQGVQCLPLPAAVAARSADPDSNARWLADPAAVAAAEQALDRRFEPVAQPAWLLRCAQSGWNIAQFDLSLSSGARRGQQLRQALRQFRQAPAWRPARWGLAALLVAHLLGLNLAAWNETRQLAAKRQALRQTLQQTFPQVTLVLDAPLQMQRELARLQQSAGQLSPRDLEAMLSALGQGGGVASARRITYQSGQLRLEAADADLRNAQALLPIGLWSAQLDGQALQLQAATP